jgi:phosphate transport system permease protein
MSDLRGPIDAHCSREPARGSPVPPTPTSAASRPAATAEHARRARTVSFTRIVSHGFTLLTLLFLAAMLGLFLWQSLPVWRHEGTTYLTGNRWFYRAELFGALPMIFGTAVVALIALALAAPIGIGAAVFTAEMLPRRWRLGVKVLVELLAGVPSVVYGLLGILYLRNWIYNALEPFDPLSGDTLLTAGVLLAVMILPTVMTLSDDALRGVPAAQRLAARGLGLTRAETVFGVTLPQAWPGMVAALLLGLGRALGETIAVFLVIGRQDNQALSVRSILEAGQTLTSKLGGSETNIAYGDPLHWAAMVGLGLILLVMVGTCTLVANLLASRGDPDGRARCDA